jgi:hypothetical protein
LQFEGDLQEKLHAARELKRTTFPEFTWIHSLSPQFSVLIWDLELRETDKAEEHRKAKVKALKNRKYLVIFLL